MEEKKHSVILEDRKRLMISSCEEVISFNENEIVLCTNSATMIIKGNSLKVREVSGESGDVVIEGESIDSVVDTKGVKSKKEGLIGRIIK